MRPVEAGEKILAETVGAWGALYTYQRRVLEAVDKALFAGGAIIARLPTGYGKTLIAAAAGLAAITEGAAHRVIHTYPATSMIQHLIDSGRELRAFEKLLREWLGNHAQVLRRVVAARHEFRHESPMLTEPYVVTTLDTLVMHYLKTRYAREESRKPPWAGTYSEFSAGIIRNSVLVFDEAHMYPFIHREWVAKEKGVAAEFVGRAVTIMAHIMGEHASLGGITIMMSATIPDQIMRSVKDYLRGFGVRVTEIVYESGSDARFEKSMKKSVGVGVRRVETDRYRRSADVGAEAAKELCSIGGGSGTSVLVVMNTVRAAREAYERIRKECGSRYRTLLIHGSFTRPDAERKLREMRELLKATTKNGKGVAVVSTQVVEASIDEDFDHLITEASPMDSLIQRMGRLQRRGSEGREGILSIIKPVSRKSKEFLGAPPYDRSLTEASLRIIERIIKKKSSSSKNLVNEMFLNSSAWVTKAYSEAGYAYLSLDQEIVDFLSLITVRTPATAVERFQRYLGGLVRSGISYKALLIPWNAFIRAVKAYAGREKGEGELVNDSVKESVSSALREGNIVKIKEWEFTDATRKASEKIWKACRELGIGSGSCPVTKEGGAGRVSYPIAIPVPEYVSGSGVVLDFVEEQPGTKHSRLTRALREGAYLILPETPDIYTSELGLNIEFEGGEEE